MIRVLLLSNMYPSERWPIYGPFVKAHEEALRASGEVAITRVAITERRKGWRAPLKYIAFFLRAWGVSLTRRFDIVHVHYGHPTAIGATVAWLRGASVVITAHGGDVNEKLLRASDGGPRRSFLLADHIIAVSEDLRAKLMSNLGRDCPPVSVMNMGVDCELFTDSGARDRTQPQRPARLLFVGRLVPHKGPDTLLQALPSVDFSWHLTVVGDGPLLTKLKRFCSEHHLENRIEFRGFVAPGEMPALCRSADLLVGPSRMEGLGLAFLEAAACGCPVLATRVGGIPEILIDEESALLVPPDDPEALAAAIRRALTDHDLRARLIRGGREVARRNSLSASIEHTLHVYRGLLGRAS